MKKYMLSCFIAMLGIFILIFVSCGNEEKSEERKPNMNNGFSGDYIMDDSKTLEDSLTTEYDLDELCAFFEGKNMNEQFRNKNAPVLTFYEVNNRYPIEVLRTGGYSVYKVRQGGYFYVFWVSSFSTETNSKNELCVYFSAYLSSDKSSDLFDSLMPSVSTAEDVRKIDPYFELTFLLSSGTYSYSYLDDKTILQIEYMRSQNVSEYDDLVVKEKTVLPRDSQASGYSAILSKDLP